MIINDFHPPEYPGMKIERAKNLRIIQFQFILFKFREK